MSEVKKHVRKRKRNTAEVIRDTKKERLLGVAEGMSIVRESEREEEDKSA